MAKWDYNNQVVCYLLLQCLPDLLAVQSVPFPTMYSCWYCVTEEFAVKSVIVQNDLKLLFLEMHCAKGENVCTFLSTLHQENLHFTFLCFFMLFHAFQ